MKIFLLYVIGQLFEIKFKYQFVWGQILESLYQFKKKGDLLVDLRIIAANLINVEIFLKNQKRGTASL